MWASEAGRSVIDICDATDQRAKYAHLLKLLLELNQIDFEHDRLFPQYRKSDLEEVRRKVAGVN